MIYSFSKIDLHKQAMVTERRSRFKMKEREKKERTQAWEWLGKWSPLLESRGTMLFKNA